jgi:3-hydroxyacyl-CoA dehydrogenase
MQVGILGSGLMGGKLGTLFARARHEVVFSYARSEQKLQRLSRTAPLPSDIEESKSSKPFPAYSVTLLGNLRRSEPCWPEISRAIEEALRRAPPAQRRCN